MRRRANVLSFMRHRNSGLESCSGERRMTATPERAFCHISTPFSCADCLVSALMTRAPRPVAVYVTSYIDSEPRSYLKSSRTHHVIFESFCGANHDHAGVRHDTTPQILWTHLRVLRNGLGNMHVHQQETCFSRASRCNGEHVGSIEGLACPFKLIVMGFPRQTFRGNVTAKGNPAGGAEQGERVCRTPSNIGGWH